MLPGAFETFIGSFISYDEENVEKEETAYKGKDLNRAYKEGVAA